MTTAVNKRILVIDDDPNVREAYREILAAEQTDDHAEERDALLLAVLGAEESTPNKQTGEDSDEYYQLSDVGQGADGIALARNELERDHPFAVAIVDMRMPPGLNGIETIKKLWERDPYIQTILCTAYSDYGWDQIQKELGSSDRLLILKKPFDGVELQQMVKAQTIKWNMAREDRHKSAALLRQEKELYQTRKLEAIGRMASGIAHDINNVMAAIIGFCDINQMTGVNCDETITEIKVIAKNAGGLTEQLLSFCRKRPMKRESFELSHAIEEVSPLLKQVLGPQCTLEISSTSEPLPVLMDPSHITQILLNLCANARDAMLPDGGKVTLTVTKSDDAMLCMKVRDSGLGMDQETLDCIWEPFFTTKPVGEGTGMGLSTVFGIVRQNDGLIEVESQLGEGTIFIIHLPLCEDESDAIVQQIAV